MYSILIVEDEPLELEALAKMVRAYPDQIGAVFEARDSMSALSLARAHSPDIIFMDINIPGKTGLEVIEALRDEHYRGIVVIITAYGQFEYAQVALRLGVADYLLKPVDRTELAECLQKMFAKLERTNSAEQGHSRLKRRLNDISAYMQPIALDALRSATDAEETMRALFDWPQDGQLQAFALCFHFDDALSPDEQKRCCYDFCALSNFQFSIVASAQAHDLVFALQSLEALAPARLELTLWCIVHRMMQFIGEHDRLCTITAGPMYVNYAEFSRFGQDAGAPFPDAPPLRLEAIRRTLRSSTRLRQSKAVMRLKTGAPDRAISVFKAMLASPDTQWAGLYCVLDALAEYSPSANVLDALHYVLDQSEPMSVSLLEWLRRHVTPSAPAGTSPSGFLIQSALGIIRQEFGDPLLSQSNLAERLGLSQAYFSRLFKKELGETFIACLTRTRLTRAKELLDLGEPVSGIAEACGYQSKKYFLDAFRQYFNISVTQYLEGDEAP